MRNIATMRAISKAQLRDFFSIGSIVLAEISAEFSISRSILALYNNNSRQSIKKMLVSQQLKLLILNAEVILRFSSSPNANSSPLYALIAGVVGYPP